MLKKLQLPLDKKNAMVPIVELSAIVTHGGGLGFTEHPDLVTSVLCAVIRVVTASWACHVLLLVRSLDPTSEEFSGNLSESINWSRCGSACALEDGFTGLPDALSGQEPHIGVSATKWSVRRAHLVSNWTEVVIGVIPKSRLTAAYARLKNASFSLDPNIWLRLATRSQTQRPSEYVCSTWAAAFLVEIGCLSESPKTWNAAPGDFLNNTLSIRCGEIHDPLDAFDV